MRSEGRGGVGRWARRAMLGTVPAGLLARRPRGGLRLALDAVVRQRPEKVYGRIGTLEVRLARTRAEIKAAQRLRYEVFYGEMSAVPSFITQMRRLDEDAYDAVCDHLMVVDTAPPADASVRWTGRSECRTVGTYRILRQEHAQRAHGFYTQSEFDIASLVAARGPRSRFMELGRSCVLKPYRNKRTLELLWHGLWTYVREHKVDVMVGCASFEGTDPDDHAMALSWLHHFAVAPEEWRVGAHPHLRVAMDRLPKSAIDTKAAMKALPPLIKGYLRLGAYVGDGAVIDHQFGTTDVLIVLPVEKIDPRYFEHFGAPEERECRVAVARSTAN